MEARLTRDQLAALRDQSVYDRVGDKIGGINRILYDKATGDPEWVAASTGFLGTKTVLMPLAEASLESDGLRVPYTKDQVKDAPDITIEGGEISEADEQTLYRHYGLSYSERRSASGLPESRTPRAEVVTEREREVTERPRAPQTGERVELREEELRAQKRPVEAGEVEVRKDVVSEQRTMEVPVTREEVYVERHPVEGREVADRPVGEGENIRVPVREEEVTVEKQPVVREELEIGKRPVQETEQISDTVQREVVDIDREGRIDVDEQERRGRRL